MPRPSWSGHLRVSLVTCPISLAPGTSEADRIRLNQINPKTGNRISLKPVDAETGEPVERADIVKGYQYEKGQYVRLEKEDLDAIQIESTRILDLTSFVDRASVNELFVETPYYGWPLGLSRWPDRPKPIDAVSRYSCPVLSLFGGADPGIPQSAVDEFAAACRTAGVKHDATVYPGAPHSFFDRKQLDFAEASADAWKRVRTFVGAT